MTKLNSMPSLYGELTIPDWPDDLILRSLRDLGEWAEVESQLLARLLPNAPRFWDVGAFLGTVSLGVARHCNLTSVLAIEANPALGGCLQSNLARNFAGPSKVVTAGVGPDEGWLSPVAQPELSVNHGAQSYSFSVTRPAEVGPAAIPCKSLRQLRALHGDYDAIKLDVEEMESAVLLADQAYIRAHQPVIWAECNEALSSLDLFGALKWLGYAPLYVAFPVFRKANFRGRSELIYPMAYEAALVGAPVALVEAFDPRIVGEDIICRPVNTGFDLRRALFDTPRWCTPAWAAMNRAELIAELGRVKTGTQLSRFLLRD